MLAAHVLSVGLLLCESLHGFCLEALAELQADLAASVLGEGVEREELRGEVDQAEVAQHLGLVLEEDKLVDGAEAAGQEASGFLNKG